MDERTCALCSSLFQPTRRDVRFCSRPCGKRAARDSSTKTCVLDGCDKPMRARGLCGSHYSQDFKVRNPDWRKRWPEDVDRRRGALRKRTQQRRARLRDPDAELIDRDEIAERDGWHCGLCGKRVSESLAWPHPRSASLDHIEPLSLGGKHTRANVQLAHLDCNMSKGNRSAGDQLLLFG